MSSGIFRFFLILLILNICGMASAQENQKLTITGRVVDNQARPVEGAEVAVYQEWIDCVISEDDAKMIGTIVTTDSNGRFAVDADLISDRAIGVVARKEGKAIGWDYFMFAQVPKDVLIVLEKPCVTSGVVVDEKGNPVAGAKIRAVPKTSYLQRLEQSPILEPRQWFTDVTDAGGKFLFEDFSLDVCTDFWVEASGRSLTYQYTTNYLSGWGFEAGRTDVRLALPQEFKTQGRVVDAESGSPIEGAQVVIHPDNIREHKNPFYPKITVSGPDGRFVFEGVPPGRHFVNVIFPFKEELQWVDKRVRFEVQSQKPVQEVLVELNKGGLIEILVCGDSIKKPVSGALVYFWEAVQNEYSGFYKYAVTGQDGILRIYAPPGECAFSTNYYRHFFQSYQDQILVTKGQTAKSQIIFDGYPCISGFVFDDMNQPVSGALVSPIPFRKETVSGQDGRFETIFDPREPCERLFVRHIERNLALIVEVGDSSKPVQVKLKPAMSLVGRLTEPDGVGIPAARIDLALRMPGWIMSLGKEILTDEQGRYEIKAVPQAIEGVEYRISVNVSGYGIKQFERLPIEGEPGIKTQLKPLVLQRADQTISGVVVDAENKPASGIPIVMQGKDQPARHTVTGEEGRFIIRRVCKGPLRIQANLSGDPQKTGTIRAEGGDQNVKIIFGQDRVQTRHISLIGRQLPDLRELKIDLSSADVKDKRVLVNFFDFNQRPSRNCILQLSKRAQELKSKDIFIIAIQASNIEQEKFDEWTKENNITFPIGMIRNDEEKTRLAWGVKSLPWLILTDKNHIVTAEGIKPSELDENIEP